MGTGELKVNLHKLIDGVSDISLLEEIYTLLSNASGKKNDWFDTLSEKDKESVKRGLADLEKGRTISHDGAMKKISAKISRFSNARG